MKKTIGSLFLLGTVFFAASQKTINDANAEKRSVSSYHGVSVSGNIELFLIQGDDESVAISADDVAMRDKVVTEVDNGILRIHLERKKNFEFNWGNKSRIRAYVSVKNIDYLASAGSGKTHIEGALKSDKLQIEISGSGNVEGEINIKDLSLGLSGSANADVSGAAENADVHISGSGNIRSYDFTTAFCKASISGSGNIRITVGKELSAHISGSGSVFIKGDGMIRDYSATGSGKFKRVN